MAHFLLDHQISALDNQKVQAFKREEKLSSMTKFQLPSSKVAIFWLFFLPCIV